MTRLTRGCAAVLLLATCLTASAQVKEADVQIRVVDAQGKPVPNVQVAQVWQFFNGEYKPLQQGGAPMTTDVQGIATGKQQFFRTPFALSVFDTAGDRGGITIVTEEEALRSPLTITLSPLRPVVVNTKIDGWTQEQLPNISGTLMYGETPATVMVMNLEPNTTLRLPAANYGIRWFSFETNMGQPVRFSVPAGREPVQPVALNLERSPLAKAVGGEPPRLVPTEGVGVPASFRLADLKGKWVLFEVWGYW
jgi:hypothetical protein